MEKRESEGGVASVLKPQKGCYVEGTPQFLCEPQRTEAGILHGHCDEEDLASVKGRVLTSILVKDGLCCFASP